MTCYLYCDSETFNLEVKVTNLRAAIAQIRESQGIKGRLRKVESNYDCTEYKLDNTTFRFSLTRV